MKKFTPKNVATEIRNSLRSTFNIPSNDFFAILPTSNKGYSVTFESPHKDIYACNIYLTPSHISNDEETISPLFAGIEVKLRVVSDDSVTDCFRELRLLRISDFAQIPLILYFVQKASLQIFENTDHHHIYATLFEDNDISDKVRGIVDTSLISEL